MLWFFLRGNLSPPFLSQNRPQCVLLVLLSSEQHGVKMEELSLKDPLPRKHSTVECLLAEPQCCPLDCWICVSVASTAHNSGLESHDFCRKVQAFSLTGTSSGANGAVTLPAYKKCAAVFLCISNLNLRWGVSTNDTIKPQIHLHYCGEQKKTPIIITTRCYSVPYRRDECMTQIVFHLT